MKQPTLVTAALPYANGAIHLGHLVEYLMTDIYVRGLRFAGREAWFICADDTHGTPIELNAQKLGVRPEDVIAKYAVEHLRDFTDFGIRFDYYGSTNSETNRRWVHEIYGKLRSGGHIKTKSVEQFYDEKAGRFLPDRFVKGTCPRCDAADQYGDVCEVCGATYEPTDLKDPKSVVTNTRPVLKTSEHFFVDLSAFSAMLTRWVKTPGRLPPETQHFVDSWLETGLKDWCITRDAPYFGFAVPDAPGKFFYVWIDAPVGYISATTEWAEKIGAPERAEAIWRKNEARVEHVIGKDIVYFHTLFWPAMLHAAGLKVPDQIHVHGMLTVDGVKMSKTRGTFINARTFLDHLDPTYLRYYYASKLGPKPDDIDLSLNEFVSRVNAELVNTLVNLVSRGLPFGPYGKLPSGIEEHRRFVAEKTQAAKEAYLRFDLSSAVRAAIDVASLGNKLLQDGQPWKTIKEDRPGTQSLVTLCLNLARAATVLLAPVVPDLAEKICLMLGLKGAPTSFDEALAFDLVDCPTGAKVLLLERITPKQVEAIIEASKSSTPGTPGVAPPATDPAAAVKAKTEPKPEVKKPPITIEEFEKLDLRVGLVKTAEYVEGADKLLRLTVDLGEPTPRTVFAGIRGAYTAEEMVGKRVAVVANLAPRKMRFGTSEGMILAGGPGGKDVWVLTLSDAAVPGAGIH